MRKRGASNRILRTVAARELEDRAIDELIGCIER